MKITDIKQDRELLARIITSAGYEVSGHSNDAVIGRIMMIIGTQYLQQVIHVAHLNTMREENDTTAILEAAKELGRAEVLDSAISSSLLAYPNGKVTWIDPVSIQLKRGSRSEFLDAHRQAAS